MLGTDLEIDAKFYDMFMSIHLDTKNTKGIEETKKAIFKLYYPDIKDPSENLMEEMQRRIVDDKNKVMRLGTQNNKTLDPSTVNTLLNKS